jgi:putative ABC transport system ATP-binding protein
VITHNAAIRDLAHQVISFADGQIAATSVNDRRLAPADISW